MSRVFAEGVFDGDELREIKPKMLRRLLTTAGMKETTFAVEAILNQRDAALSNGKSAVSPTECPCCFEVYRDDGDGLHVPRILPCGHSACQDCFARLLRPIVAEGNVKELPCPSCRVVMKVSRGRASNLTKNFALLR